MATVRRWHPAVLALFVALMLATTAVVVSSSRGAFFDTTDNAGNSFEAAASFGGGITQVQKATAGSAGKTTSVTATYGSAPTQDNLLILVHHWRETGTVTLPSGWSQAVARVDGPTTFTIAYKIAGAAEGTAVTVSTAKSDHQTITIFEYSGIDTASPLDQTVSNTSTNATSCSTGTTGTTSVADELLVAGIGLRGAPGVWANTWTNSFTQQSTVVSTGGGDNELSASSTADRIVSATGTFATTESWTTSYDCIAAIATFKAAP
ncbi:MAG: hypothetical protein IIC72_12885 [Acidobacteria bacterium]|nr:hypothetical protein [Acidobacteriota bacterium]